jgi:hypothetical protein
MESTYDVPTAPAPRSNGMSLTVSQVPQPEPEPQLSESEPMATDEFERRAQFEADRAAGALRRKAQDSTKTKADKGKLSTLRGLGKKGLGKKEKK